MRPKKILKARLSFVKAITDRKPAMRTPTVDGFVYELPKVRECFALYGQGLEVVHAIRTVITSPVQEILEKKDGKLYEFRTKNSYYKLEILN